MEINGEGKSSSTHDKECVRVAVNVRPLITSELLLGCTDCITVFPGEPQVQIGSHAFTFDYVFGSGGIPCARIFDECVAPLIDALFKGYNGTVLAYGQTGSGKTYTMGTNYSGGDTAEGIIPKVMHTIFSRVESMRGSTEFLIRVSFIEIFKEEVFDLLEAAKSTGPSRAPIQIRETVNGGITLAGVTEAEVRSKEEMATYLTRGSVARATGSTNMNSQSSRSHAIFTIAMEQKKIVPNGEISEDILSAKLHLVDLAGSERAKRTGADGMRLKEGIHINKGLLALGNVISALGDEKKRKEGGHVPYRDSKLTRLLQDSLGGNSKTVMIACVSPADTNAEETLNTLKYANRTRNIQNKAVVNRDPIAAQMQKMRGQIEQLQAELLYYRGDSSVSFEELQILKHKISLLEESNAELQRELQERRISCEHLAQRARDAQVEKDQLIIKLEAARNGKPWDEIEPLGNQEIDLVKSYVSKIQELEQELVRLQHLSRMKRDGFHDFDSDDDALPSKNDYLANLSELSSESDTKEMAGVDIEEKELEHSSLQERLDMELKELDRKLQQKEAEMKRVAGSDTSVLKQHYEKKVFELEHEKKALQKEIEDLKHKLGSISSTSGDGAQKLKEEYLQKLNVLESQVSELKKKQEAQAQILRQKQKSDDAAKRLQDEIQRIKSQKVQLQNKIKQESEQFRLWKASREKEVLQLKKEGRRNEYEMHKLLALNQRQKMVLQRKTEEASMATKRLKELLESRKAASREGFAAGIANGPGAQALMHGIEHELEVTVRVHEVRSQYERQMEERTKMAQEIARLKEEAVMLKQNNLSECPESMSPGARNSRIFALENMLATSSSTLVSMASQLSEAEERERVFSGRGRWNQVRSLAEAKNLMNFLFNLASSSRCMVRDRELDCREKDSEIKDLKEKVVKLNGCVKQLEKQNSELKQQLQHVQSVYGEIRTYDLRQGPRSSGFFKFPGNSLELLEDMDTSDSEHSQSGEESADDEWVHPMFIGKKRNARKGGRSGSESQSLETDGSESLKREDSVDTVSSGKEKSIHGLCCSCSKQSFCKTMKCECRAVGGNCSESCGCSSNKCSNREDQKVNVEEQDTGSKKNGILPDEVEHAQDLASQGATLLRSALADMPAEQREENCGSRKPLADIGNTTSKLNAPKPNKRKTWRKSTIQLVPAAPASGQAENQSVKESNAVENNVEAKPESSTAETNIPLKLPRAMRSASSNISNPLRVKNSEHGEEPVVQKESGEPARRSPLRRPKKTEEKENFNH
ncbi:kinesin-like protein KIN-4C [Amaranthus tricolor]|uniref:kinesin-like protein KIN-4C n=1 Tax=Amaranthus tricolor TaxID=29722 RepID=UPI00258CA859|nr:kinesin-like protein KIN-4C [Amaranthus tricolor]XP_057533121.1 kinesin-like protein KIN-4C [Amaranthus tricolor]